MKHKAITLIAAAAFSTSGFAESLDSVFRVVEATGNIMNAGAKMLENGAVIGAMDSQVSTGKVTQLQSGGRGNTQEMNMGSVVGGKVIGGFQARVNTGDVTQLQNSTDSRQSLNFAVVK